MIKILVYIACIIAAVAVFSALADLSGYAVIELEGQRLDISTNFLIGLTGIALIFFFFGGALTNWIVGLPKRIRRRAQDRRRARGMIALSRGLEAVAAGDAQDAQHHARTASKALTEPALTRLLTAQAAQLAGDRETAKGAYTAMLDAPETEFLGLRGLYMHALQSGDREEARAYAERAFRLRPGAAWAFQSVLELSLERGAWGDALETLTLAKQHDSADGPEYKRMESALHTAQAYAAFDSEDQDTVLKDAEAALKKSPGLTPAAALAAEAEVAAGRRSKAARILGDAWEAAPHPGLVAAMRRIFSHERDERVEGRLIKLAGRNPEHHESKLLLASLQLKGGEAAAAQETLEPLLTGRPNRRVLILMAEITEARYGEAAAGSWQEKAAAAPEEFIPGADGTFHYTTEGWRRLVQEYSDHERLAPPPLEVETPEIPADVVQALLMAPAEEAARQAVAEEPEDAEVTSEETDDLDAETTAGADTSETDAENTGETDEEPVAKTA